MSLSHRASVGRHDLGSMVTLTQDPLPGSARDPSFPEGLNAYAYVQNNPVNRVDPTGMLSEGPQDDQFLALLLAAGIDEEVLRARACLLGYIGLITSVAAVILLLTPPFGSLINPVNIQAAGVFAVLAVLATITISTQCGDSG